MRRGDRAFLPARVVAHLVADEVVVTYRRLQRLEPLLEQRLFPLRRAAQHVVHLVPRDADAGFHMARIVRMYLRALRNCELETLRRRKSRELFAGFGAERVRTQHHALLAMDAMRRIPDLLDVLKRPGNTAIDSFALPEALLHLEADLEKLAARDLGEARGISGREVVLD